MCLCKWTMLIHGNVLHVHGMGCSHMVWAVATWDVAASNMGCGCRYMGWAHNKGFGPQLVSQSAGAEGVGFRSAIVCPQDIGDSAMADGWRGIRVWVDSDWLMAAHAWRFAPLALGQPMSSALGLALGQPMSSALGLPRELALGQPICSGRQ